MKVLSKVGFVVEKWVLYYSTRRDSFCEWGVWDESKKYPAGYLHSTFVLGIEDLWKLGKSVKIYSNALIDKFGPMSPLYVVPIIGSGHHWLFKKISAGTRRSRSGKDSR